MASARKTISIEILVSDKIPTCPNIPGTHKAGRSTAAGPLWAASLHGFLGNLVLSLRLWGESSWLLLVPIFTSQSQSISVLPYFYFPSASFLTAGLLLFSGQFAASGGLCTADVVSVQRGRGGWCPRALPGLGAAEPPCPVLPAQHWAPLVMPPIRTAPGTGTWPAGNQKIGPVVVFWGFQLDKGFRSALDKFLSSSFCGAWIFFLLTSMCFGSGPWLG